jgi:DNA polymerase III epsilon subunit-like protein|tara:strand:- start:161 stop:742 length:582 start_codon:yes stop_codon:yes gene_type:complete
MPKNICILYTETNGLHKLDESVSKKNSFGFARLVCLNYIIGYKKDGEFKELKKVRNILKPKCINFDENAIKYHKISQKKAEKKGLENTKVIKEFQNDLKGVRVIVSHNLPFHIRAIQVELFKTCTYINFDDFILIDTINFYHKYDFLKLKELSNKILKKKFDNKKAKYNTTIIKNIFMKLYNDYEKTVLTLKQ